MLILGILLIAVALVVFGYMFLGTRDLQAMDIDLGVFTVELTPLHLYLLGAATLVVLTLGLLLLAAGLRASRRRRHEVKELRKAVHDGEDTSRPAREHGRSPATSERSGRRETDYERDVPPAPESRHEQSRDASATGAAPRNAGQEHRADDPQIALPSDYHQDSPPDGTRSP